MPTLYGFRLPQCFTKIVCGHPVLLSSKPDQRHKYKAKGTPAYANASVFTFLYLLKNWSYFESRK